MLKLVYNADAIRPAKTTGFRKPEEKPPEMQADIADVPEDTAEADAKELVPQNAS